VMHLHERAHSATPIEPPTCRLRSGFLKRHPPFRLGTTRARRGHRRSDEPLTRCPTARGRQG
jgi:hypothetical protein